MKNKLLFAFLLYAGFSYSQTKKSPWKTTTLNYAQVHENKKQLVNPKLFGLDLPSLKSTLSKAPNRYGTSRNSNIIVDFPNADGLLEHFQILKTSNLDPALADRYPEIKSYTGQSVEHPGTVIYFSVSPLGLQSMAVTSNGSAIFIEPYTVDAQIYTVYKKSDKAASLSKFECKVIANATSDIINSEAARPNADDGKLRNYRLALSCTGEYTTYFGGTKALALAAMNNTMTRINGVFEMDFGVHLNLIATNDLLIYTNAATDPYSPANLKDNWSLELQNNLTTTIGNAAYDIGHLFGGSGGGGNAGCIGCVCVDDTVSTTDKNKGSGYTSPADGIPTGDNFDIDYVAHEFGHQFGANHTFTHSFEGTGVHMEPGSGSTIMGYAGITALDVQPHSDAYFHAISIQQVTDYIKTTTCQTTTITGNAIPTANAGLDYFVPISTPFMITGTATDANGDALTYTWEQMNSGTPSTSVPTATKTTGPNFRSYAPSSSPTRYFPRMTSVLSGSTTTAGSEINVEALPSVGRSLNFRFTVRDNRAGGPSNNSDDMVVTVTASAGPFVVNSPNTAVSYIGTSTQTITWAVAGTTANNINCANVDILLSTDGGNTFPTILAAATPNDGTQSVTMPNVPGINNRIMVKGTNHIFFDVSNTSFTITNSTPDTIAPTAPVLAASGTTSTTTTLSWSGATDNIGVTDYNVYQNDVLIGSTLASTYNVSGLTAATSYSFTVRAKDASVNLSPASNIVIITTLLPVACNSQGNSIVDERIGNVLLGSINNTSVGGTGYTDFTSISTNLTLGASQSITITPTWTGTRYNEGYAVFIDYNRDGDFSDTGETVFTNAPTNAVTVTGTFTVPATASVGRTRMRVSLKYNAIPTACETFSYGQVEDYTIILTPPPLTIVTVKLNIEGYYDVTTHAMKAVKANQGDGASATDVENITVELRNASTYSLIASTTAALKTNGDAICTFATSPTGTYYIAVKHLNAVQTWSAIPVAVGATPVTYDFSNAAEKAFGSNQVLLESGVWALYSGDINADGNVDNGDFVLWAEDANEFASGDFSTDVNGDGNVDNDDFAIWASNANGFVYAIIPGQ